MRRCSGRDRQWCAPDAQCRSPRLVYDLLARAAEDRIKRALTGVSDLADRNEILLPDRQSAELGAVARGATIPQR